MAAFGAAGLGFAVLGKEETCGEVVRGVGEDGLFTEMALGSLDTFDRYGIGEIVTPCPHGLHTFTNHYARLDQAMKGRKACTCPRRSDAAIHSGSLSSKAGAGAAVHVDPCFLGRRGGVFDAPRNVLRAIPGVELVEMGRARENSFCWRRAAGGCGRRAEVEEKMSEIRLRGGGGHRRGRSVTACPFCFTNFDDAVKTAGFEGRIAVKDLTGARGRGAPGQQRHLREGFPDADPGLREEGSRHCRTPRSSSSLTGRASRRRTWPSGSTSGTTTRSRRRSRSWTAWAAR
ncbi:MAG: (Fe-S)-binding protein [Marinilabiliales bacterium]|nr:(Fe-S)-binding protein [Marinilabiliales bacterium]